MRWNGQQSNLYCTLQSTWVPKSRRDEIVATCFATSKIFDTTQLPFQCFHSQNRDVLGKTETMRLLGAPVKSKVFVYDSYIKFERTYLGNGNFYAYLELFVENCPAEFDVTFKVAFDVDQHKVVSQQGHCAQYLPNAVLQLISLFQLLQSNFLKKSFSVKSSRWQFLHCIPCFQKSP